MSNSDEKKVRFATHVPKKLKDEVSREAKKHNKSLNDLGEMLLKKFMGLPKAIRDAELQKLPNKIFGRPI